MPKVFFLSILFFQLLACKSKKEQLEGLWFYTHFTGNSAGSKTALNPTSYLLLMNDGTYTRDFTSFETGKWTLVNNKIELTNSGKKTEKMEFVFQTARELQIIDRDGNRINFESSPIPANKPTDNPFSRENNRWRIPATAKESDAQIRERLINHCKFWELYFAWALQNKIATVDVRSTPTCIKIYGNGFGLKPWNDLPDRWKSYFFDAEDCLKANRMVEDVFKNNNISWARTDNKYKMFLSAFQQMQQYLKE